jgi:DNA processing protein
VRSTAIDTDEPAEEESPLLKYLGHDVANIDTLCIRSGLTAETVSAMLLSLELDGVVATLPGGYYQRLR